MCLNGFILNADYFVIYSGLRLLPHTARIVFLRSGKIPDGAV